MTAKLTLSMDKTTIEKAKRVAGERHTSVSAMFARFVSGLDRLGHPDSGEPLGPTTRAATGLVELPAEAPDRQLVEDALWERYGSRE
ncbi:MAG TPA: hypothetical protein EYP19_01970 [Desulfobacterales bacterium]|nr:hypothetical protein [Desulfobacterales bacterium]